MIRIGYQGEIGSNNEAAAEVFVKDLGLNKGEYELVPLVESRYVASYLKSKKIDYGIVATRNSEAGAVKESYEAIKDEYFEFVQTIILPIHHCVFIKPNVSEDSVTVITSHIQALRQTENNRKERFPNWVEKEANDTASAARNLSEGIFPDNYAVICRKNAGEHYGLKMISENIEDEGNNRTEFRVYKVSSMDYSENNKPSIWQWFTYQFVSENGMSYIAQGIMMIGIIVAIILSQKFNMNTLDVATTIGSYTAIIIIFFTSNNFRSNRRYKTLEGYWKYYSMSTKDLDGNAQKFTTPRIVKITEEDGELHLEGVICDKENVPMFESKTGEVFVSSIGKKKGGLVYAYESPAVSQRKQRVKGIAYVTWRTKYASSTINIMRGMYYGTMTGDEGTLTYLRITEEEYNRHRESTFL